jgi:hypothetical protein
MGRFHLAYFFFPVIAFLGSLQRVFLLGNHTISSNQKLFNFFFVSVIACSLSVVIFFVFAMEMEDNFGQLRYLLRHLVVSFL